MSDQSNHRGRGNTAAGRGATRGGDGRGRGTASGRGTQGRGDGHGRGQNTGRGASHTAIGKPGPQARSMEDGLEIETPITTVDRPSEVSSDDISLKDLVYIGSYNWVDDVQPTILVPGAPREWHDKPVPFTVPPDKGHQFVDQNGYRMGTSTLYPLFRAVDVVQDESGTSIDWNSVDFVTDRNNLRKLLRWIQKVKGSDREFRIDTQLAGKRTVLLNRWEKKTRVFSDPRQPIYGFSFERETTTKADGCERGTAYHRIVKYDFGGLTLVVRYEVDAYLAPPRSSNSSIDDVADQLSGLSVSSIGEPDPIKDDDVSTAKLKIIRAGFRVPHDSIVEMTTRSKKSAAHFDWNNAYGQLYLSQTLHHFLAVHQGGVFEAINKRRLDDLGMQAREENLQGSLRTLCRALKSLQELVMRHGHEGGLSLLYRNGELQVFQKSDKESYLPEEVLDRFTA